MTNLTLEELPNGIKLYQNEKGYKFTKDAIDLAKFCKVKPSDSVLEMCAGCGIISFYLYGLSKFSKLYLNEIQKSFCEIINKNIELNSMQTIANCIEGNLKDLSNKNFDKKLDVIICNPPYFKIDGHKINEEYSIAVARHEIEVTLEELVMKAKTLIKDKGKFYLVLPSSRLVEVITCLSNQGFEVKRLKFLTNGTKQAYLVLIESVFRAKTGVQVEFE